MLDVLLLSDLRAEEQSRGLLLRSGGSAANTAAWLAFLDCPTTFVGCVGDDPLGATLARELEAGGVTTWIRAVVGTETGAVAVEISPAGERVMRSARGANEMLSPDDVRAVAKTAELTAVHVTGYALLSPFGFELFEAAADVARDRGALLSFDPSSRGVVGRIGADRLLMELVRLDVGIFLPSLEEAEALTGASSAVEAATLLAASFPLVFVKNGAMGAAWSAGGETGHVPAVLTEAKDTTGAGDAFNAGILAAVTRGQPPARACLTAHGVARQVIQQYGGRPAAQ